MGEQLTTARVATARITALATASEQFDEGLIDLDHFLDAVSYTHLTLPTKA